MGRYIKRSPRCRKLALGFKDILTYVNTTKTAIFNLHSFYYSLFLPCLKTVKKKKKAGQSCGCKHVEVKKEGQRKAKTKVAERHEENIQP